MLTTLRALGASDEETFRTILTAYAESDFFPEAKAPTDDTWGLFQQNPRWWGTLAQILDPVYATISFVVGRPGLPALRKIILTDNPVVDCWRVQKWGIGINPDVDRAAFLAHPSTVNYTRRLAAISELIADPYHFDPENAPGPEPRIVTLVGGALTLPGPVLLDSLPGSSPADKLRRAWAPGQQDRRCIVVPHGTVIDVGADPIPAPAGVCLAGPAGPQTEFSDQGRVILRGATAAFRSVDSGPVYRGTKGWSFVNLGFEGQANLRFFAENRMDAAGPIMAYASIEGCSFDVFRTIIESPMMGCHFDIRYFNNITGAYGFKLTGSDNQLWTHGGKGDWGGSQTDPRRQALIVIAGLEKSTIGASRRPDDETTGGGLYLTCEGAAGLHVEGGATRDGVDIFGMTIEGRNAARQSAGAAYRQTGGGVNFFGGNINYAMADPGAGGRGDRAFADISGGIAAFFGTKFRRGSSGAPLIGRRGAAIVDTFGCREVPSHALVTATNL